ncbi:MAG: cytochrome c [bacterium]
MLTTRSLRFELLLFSALVISACSERANVRGETPYAARYAVAKPAYVRHASAAAPAPTIAEVFVEPQFTAEQSSRGAEVYRSVCARCHASTQWSGGTFAVAWKDRRLSDFYDLVSTTMPQDNPSGLASQQYVDVTAYVLSLAGFAPGADALRADTAMTRHVRLTVPAAK